jgi:3-oxoacyl-[acyl-carrier protein] reductase
VESDIQGKTALVTGASGGIGAASAIALAQRGCARLLLHYNTNQSGIERVRKCAETAGAEVQLFQADLGCVEGIGNFLAAVKQAAAPADILVNNAGSLVGRARLLEFTPELYDRVMNLNVKSAWFITQALAPAMIARGSGTVINVSSIAARNGGGPGATVYAAAKAAISAMTKGLAKELAPKGIRVNAVSPGTVDNDFHARFSTRQILDAMVASTPAGRLGTNEEVSDVILFLCSRASRYIYGQIIEINGGMLMV